jgi:hypothetical protein
MAITCDQAGLRGQFYSPQPTVHLDGRVFQYLSGKAQRKGVSLEDLVNDLLKKAIELSWRLEN